MAVNTRNIVVGAANIYISTNESYGPGTAATPPAYPAPGTTYNSVLNANPAGWRHVGATTSGVTVTYTPTYGEVDVDQLKDAAIMFNQGVVITAATSLAEVTLANLLMSWGQPSGALASSGSLGTMNLGVPDDQPIERSLLIVGRAPATASGGKQERIYYARRVVSIEASSHSLIRTGPAEFPVTFRLLADPSAPVGQEYGTITDRTV